MQKSPGTTRAFLYKMPSMKPVFTFQRGATPLLLSIPHAGTGLAEGLEEKLTGQALRLPDTDWFVDRLYDWAVGKGAGLMVANYSRYVIDLNRPPDDAALYSGPGTGLMPEHMFDGSPLYKTGSSPGAADLVHRLAHFWRPYHEKLASELDQIRARFGYAILLDAHSIRSEVPRLFEGRLPDFNLGSNAGESADPGLITRGFETLGRDARFTSVLDGRFKGGYITRNYGRPAEQLHALQLEMAQSCYMREDLPAYDSQKAERVRTVLHGLVDALLDWRPA